MGYIQVRYDSRVVNYDRRGFIRLATSKSTLELIHTHLKLKTFFCPYVYMYLIHFQSYIGKGSCIVGGI